MSSPVGKVAGAIRRVLLPRWKTRKIPLRNTQPIVSFTFDDFPRTALLAAGAILKNYNARGTYYTAIGLLGVNNHQGEHFDAQDLQDLLRDGHELGSHSYSHISALKSSRETFHSDVLRGESEVGNLRSAASSSQLAPGNFSYPFGDVTLACKPELGLRLRSCRGIRGGVMSGSADLNLLLANRLYTNSFDFDAIKRLIAENLERKGWLIFYTHDVRENPSDYGCTPAQFESAVRATSQSGAKILTVAQALDAIQAAA